VTHLCPVAVRLSVLPSCEGLSDERPSDVLGALPHRRPQRRSDKRAAPAGRSGPSPSTTANVTAANATRTAASTKRTAAGTKHTAAPAKRAPAARSRGARPATPQRSAPAAATRATPRRPERLRQPAQPAGVPPMPPRPGRPDQTTGRDILGIAAQAAAELAEIGLSVSARALRNAVGRLPRP
jgi:hypothetical protein